MFKGGAGYAIRKIEMSSFEIKYLRQLNSLFSKDTPANDFGELSKRFDGVLSFLSPLQWELIKQKNEVNIFYSDLLKPFLLNAAEPSVDREKASREFFMVTLPGLFLKISTKEEFESDPENVAAIVSRLKTAKEYPLVEDQAFKQDVILNLSNRVFKTHITTVDDFKDVVKNWFNSLSYAAKNRSVFEDQFINTWVKKLRSSEVIDIPKFYLEEIAASPVREWTNLAFQQFAYIDTIEKFKKEIESYTRSPLSVYQRIALNCFEMSANECSTEIIFTETFKDWWDSLPPLSKSPHYEERLTNIFVEEFSRSFSVKDKFLNYIPARWMEAGYRGIVNSDWEHWNEMEVKSIAEAYGACTKEISSWKPPIAEEKFACEIGEIFGLHDVDSFMSLQKNLSEDWFVLLPINTQTAQWPENSITDRFVSALKSLRFREFFINDLPALFDFREFKYWNVDILTDCISKLTDVKTGIESYKRPLMELVNELEHRIKKKSSSVTEFRLQLRDNLQATEAFRSGAAEFEPELLDDSRAISLLKQTKRLNSEEEFLKLTEIMAAEFGISTDYFQWSVEEQRKFCKDLQEVYSYLQKWKYPQDTSMQDAKSELTRTLSGIQRSFNLSNSQLLKILRDLIEEKSKGDQ